MGLSLVRDSSHKPHWQANSSQLPNVRVLPNFLEVSFTRSPSWLHKFPSLLLTVEPRPQGSKAERAPSKDQPLSSNVAGSDTASGVEGSGTASSDNRLSYLLLLFSLV